ncbi:hypothetical protein U6O02_12265, partial [Cutibacterium acnes]
MASATPGGVSKDDKYDNAGNNIAHFSPKIPEGCAPYSPRPAKVKPNEPFGGHFQRGSEPNAVHSAEREAKLAGEPCAPG